MPRDLDLDLGSGHMAHRRASLIDLYPHKKFHSNWRNFLWMDVRTYEWAYIRTAGQTSRPDSLGVDLKRCKIKAT